MATRATHTPFDIDTLWRLERLGTPSVAPDGAHAVAAVTRYDMDANTSSSRLQLFSTLGGRPRVLTTTGDKDGQPRYDPTGERIGFVARREQEGKKDDTPQFYVIAPDGGEARRVGDVATGIEAFRWFPDGQRIAFISWVWPGLKGVAAQAKAHKAFKERKETGYVTSEALYRHWDHNLPQDRVPHLCVMDIRTGKVSDLFEGTPYELSRREPSATCFDISLDGQRIAFQFDPAPIKRHDPRHVIVELELRTRRFKERVVDSEWDFSSPSYHPQGKQIAFLASHQGRKHTAPTQLALTGAKAGSWDVVTPDWDREPSAPLYWEDDGSALLFTAEDQGRVHLWRYSVDDRLIEPLVKGGTVSGFDKAGGVLVTLADCADHPAQLHAYAPGEPAKRMESINDQLLKGQDLGRTEELWVTGALKEKVQVWLYYPPGFDARKKYPVLHTIHGGPHTGPGDNWHYRWCYKLFAAQGYVVVNVNYHGSSSFGNAFADSITHRWGELELQDVEAATDWLLKKPWVDPRRVFATGGSYGGYMVAWMNGHCKPGRYAAYVCHAGCFDWTAMFADDAYGWHAKELGAWYWEDPARVASQSPHAFSGNFSTPTLVIHGALDYRVPDQQGLAYYNTLKQRDVDSRLLWFPDENHWILKPRNSKLWYEEFFAWLRRHDPALQPAKKASGRKAPARKAATGTRRR